MSKKGKRSGRYVTREMRRMIRRKEARIPALGSAVKLLLEIHGLEARHVRNSTGMPYYWMVEPVGKRLPRLEVPVSATLEQWQHAVSHPNDWPSPWAMDFETYNDTAWGSFSEHSQIDAEKAKALHDKFKANYYGADFASGSDFTSIEARVGAACHEYAEKEFAAAQRPLREEDPS